jgi:hypothetical protein
MGLRITDAMYNHGRRHVHTSVCTTVITPAMPQIDRDAKIDKRLYSISMPLVYARNLFTHNLRRAARLRPNERNKLSEIERTPKRTPGPENLAEVRILFLGSYRYHPIFEALHHRCDDPAYECYSLGKTYVWSKCLRW